MKEDQKQIQDLLDKLAAKDLHLVAQAKRVQALVDQLLIGFSLSKKEKKDISIAALLHDIGNLRVSDALLYKPGRLTLEEYEEMKSHVSHSIDLVQDLSNFEQIKPLILYHHENVNGFGYPEGLEGDEIPLGARLIHVAAAFVAMTSVEGLYKKTHYTEQQALQELQEFSGRIYDQDIVQKMFAFYHQPEGSDL